MSSSRASVEQLAVGARKARFVRLRCAESRKLSRHRDAALLHFFCVALASRILRELSSSTVSEYFRRRFFSGSRLGICLRRQKMQRNIKTMMINARATDRARTTTVPRWDEASIPKEVQPVGKDDMSKSSKDEGGGSLLPTGSLRSLFAVGRHGMRQLAEPYNDQCVLCQRPSSPKTYLSGKFPRS